jgi:hypothetical protein
LQIAGTLRQSANTAYLWAAQTGNGLIPALFSEHDGSRSVVRLIGFS